MRTHPLKHENKSCEMFEQNWWINNHFCMYVQLAVKTLKDLSNIFNNFDNLFYIIIQCILILRSLLV